MFLGGLLLGHEVEGRASLEPLNLVLVERVGKLDVKGGAISLVDLSLEVPEQRS